jgi:3-hydroxyacyl-CoA dehydrogenase
VLLFSFPFRLRLRASDELVEGLIARLREVRAETARLRRAVFAPSAEEKGLSAEAVLEQLERLKRSLFFAVGAQLRQAHTFLNSATSGLPLPDLTRLYEEYAELPEGQWREKLAAAFGVADTSIA